jgi:ABC-type polysaccharide/polyol phosphate transport system ATPase subunit
MLLAGSFRPMASPGASRAPAILVAGATKVFDRPREKMHTLKERVLHPMRARAHDEFEALHDVSFAVEPGEFFGVVGRNGSGKSTLLKCMAGIYGLSDGRIHVNGSMSTFIELGVGFNPDLPAYDNVVVNGIMLGLTPREARDRFERVIEFAELEEFVDLKLKNYSSGMHVRLAFSVMIQVDAEVLLVDEVLAVGDASFQQKCFDVFHELRDQGRTILLVTHDMGLVERFCDRAMLLERGRVTELGDPHDVAARYVDINFQREAGAGGGGVRAGDGSARVEEAWIEDAFGERKSTITQGEPCTFRARVRFHREVENPDFTAAWVNEHSQNAFIASTLHQRESTGHFRPGDQVLFSATFSNHLGPGRYLLSTQIAYPGGGQRLLDRWERIFSIMVLATRPTGGLVDLPHEISIERIDSASTAAVSGRSP